MIDPILIFKEEVEDDGLSQNALFHGESAWRKQVPLMANTIWYIQGPTVLPSVIRDYVDSLSAPSSNSTYAVLGQKRKERAQRMLKSCSVQDWMEEVNTLKTKVQNLTLKLMNKTTLRESLHHEHDEYKRLLATKTRQLQNVQHQLQHVKKSCHDILSWGQAMTLL
jgi:hypothetical protein